MLIYSAQSSAVSPEPQGLSVWVTITGDDVQGGSCHPRRSPRPEDKHVSVTETSSWGQRGSRGRLFKSSLETNLFALTEIQPLGLSHGARQTLRSKPARGKAALAGRRACAPTCPAATGHPRDSEEHRGRPRSGLCPVTHEQREPAKLTDSRTWHFILEEQ